MCSKYKKRNFMLLVKIVIPPNNSFTFFPRWNIFEISSKMESQEKISDLDTTLSVEYTWAFLDGGNKWRWVKLGLGLG